MSVFIEELRNLKDNIKDFAGLLEEAKTLDGHQSIEMPIREGFVIKKVIDGFKLHLSQEISTLDKNSLVALVRSFIEELASYASEWSSLLEKCFAGFSIPLGDLCVLQTTAIAAISELLIHCKESMVLYDKCFLEVSSFLSNLFKSTYHGLKVVLEILEKACLEEWGASDVSKYAICVMQMFDVSHILKDIDMMPLGNTLRCLNRIVSSKESLLHEELDATKMFKVVCSCVVDKLSFSWSLIKQTDKQTDSKRLLTVIKLLRFLLGMLLRLIKTYKNEIFGTATHWIIDVLKLLQWMTPKTSHGKLIEDLCYKEFCNTVLIVIEPLLMELIDERDFIARFRSIKVCKNDDDESREKNLSALQLTITIACQLAKAKDETKDEWMSELSSSACDSLVELAFQLYEECLGQNLETVLIPMVIEIEEPSKNVPLHEYVCIGLCAFASTLNQQNFSKLESCLVRNLMVSSNAMHLLSADVFAFIARWGPDNLCLQLTNFFANLSLSLFKATSSQSELLNRSLQMTRRLYLLLGETKKGNFLSSCASSIRDCIPLWMAFPVQDLDEQCLKEYLGFLLSSTLHGLEELDANERLKFEIMKIKVFENVLKRDNAVRYIDPTQLNSIFDFITKAFLKFKSSECEVVDEELICSLLGVLSKIIHMLEQKHINGILQVITVLVECNISSHLSFKICQLLSAFGSVTYKTDCTEYCLSSLSCLFNTLFNHQSFFVRFEAMKSLRAYAEVTEHPEVVSDCLPSNLTDNFKDFLRNVRLLDDLPPGDKENLFKKAVTVTCAGMCECPLVQEEGENIPKRDVSTPSFEFVPLPHKDLEILEKNFSNAVDAIKEYSKSKRIPESMLRKLKRSFESIEKADNC